MPGGPGSTKPSASSTPTPTARADTHLHVVPAAGLPQTGASTSTSRTSRPTPPAASSTGWPARCSSTRSATAGSTRAPRSSRRPAGSTAVSEAYFARLLGLPFVAVMPRTTSPEKIALIERAGRPVPSRRRPADGLRRGAAARRRDRRPLPRPVHLRRAGHRLARQQQHRRVDLRADGAGAAPGPAPGSSSAPAPAAPAPRSAATSATGGHATRLCVVDPERLGVLPGLRPATTPRSPPRAASRIEGIGRPRVEPSFLPGVVDRMMQVPDAASDRRDAGRSRGRRARRVGGSTGTTSGARCG